MQTRLIKISLIGACLFLLGKSSGAQNTYPVLSTSVVTECISHCLDQDSIPVITDSTVIQVTMTINLFDTTGITSIQVKLGTTSGGGELLTKTFAFDVFGSVGNGCSYFRIDNTITLGLGSFNALSTYFSEVILERSDSTFTDAIVYNR